MTLNYTLKNHITKLTKIFKIMGYILPEIYKSIYNETLQSLPEIFIETGTAKGGTPHTIIERTGELDLCFKKYYTIELGTDICKCASKRYKYIEQYNYNPPFDKNFPHNSAAHTDELDESFNKEQEYFNNRVKLINGDSGVEVGKILENIDEPCCFWLDAHSGKESYARGGTDVPLIQELNHIKNHHIKNHIIAIDDAHLFGKRQTNKQGELVCDYSNVPYETVRDKILEINPNYDIGIYAPYNMKMVIAFIP